MGRILATVSRTARSVTSAGVSPTVRRSFDRDDTPLTNTPAGLGRRIGAWAYDALLLLAVVMVVTALFLPFNGGEALTSKQAPLLELAYRCTIFAIVVLHCGYCWTRRGQT